MEKRSRRRFTEEFKAETVALVRHSGKSIAEVCRDMGLAESTVHRWLDQAEIDAADLQLFVAKQTYLRVLELTGDPPRGMASEDHLGLARIHYEWNDLDTAEQHAQQCLQITQQADSVDTFVSYAVFLARLRLARGDLPGAMASLDDAEEFLHQNNFVLRMPDVASMRVLTLLHQGQVKAAAHLAETNELPIRQARVHLARGDTTAALAVLEPCRRDVEAKDWADKRLEVILLQAMTLQAHGAREAAVHVLLGALALAESGRLVRSFVDEGTPMATLLSAAAAQGRRTDSIRKLLSAFEAETQEREGDSHAPPASQLPIERLSQRELEVLRLIAQGLSNHEIGERLFLALDTVKGHNRRIFGKLHVQRRTEAVARARELGLS